MKSCSLYILSITALVTAAGCDALAGILGAIQPTQMTTVRLVNESDFAVEGVLFYGDDQETVDGVIQETGTERSFNVGANEVESFSRPCDQLQALIIDDADLQLIGEIGPEDRTDLLRDGDDFSCGSTIVFTFRHSEIITDFEIVQTTESQ